MNRNLVCEAVDYTGKTVIVTGAAQGAGAGIARRFAQAGANVAITYNSNKDAAAEKVAEFKKLGVDAEAFHLDQRKTEEIDGVIQAIAKRFGSIDVIVNNAGIYPHQNSLDMTQNDWDDMQNSNTRGVFFVCQSVAKVMKEQKNGGAIVNVSSINATNPSDTLIHYGVSKAAVEMLTRCLAHDFGKYGIRVNCIAPGLIDAPRLDEFVPGWRESYSERAPLGRIATPEDMGNVCVFLGSPLAGFVTGQIITVDGGVLLSPSYNWN
jgi:NAD(P)-dependent dehydrogenase (short-subunit alcohol dehydrogenase family)